MHSLFLQAVQMSPVWTLNSFAMATNAFQKTIDVMENKWLSKKL